MEKKSAKKPPWLKRRIPTGRTYWDVLRILGRARLRTVCQEAMCPNLGECFSSGTATFLILGDRCTRNCGFCAVAHGSLGEPDLEEPRRVAEAVSAMGLKYAVITSVTRDDLPDGGAGHFAETIIAVKRSCPGVAVEVLIPDFLGSAESLETVLGAGPDVVNHNLETVPRLYPSVRPGADYGRSLQLLRRAAGNRSKVITKSGLMLGLGEREEELDKVFSDLAGVGCRILTLGQYLRPSRAHLPVERYVPPEEFD
ncbi:MAG: lipoyl synthase, partial [Desulfobacteraceae bacterium]